MKRRRQRNFTACFVPIAEPRPVRIEGYNSADWVLLDYGDFIIHLFNTEGREFYDLARLWRDARRVELPAEI